MTEKTKLKLIKDCMIEIDNLGKEKEAVNEEILKSELGQKRKTINARVKKLEIAMHDMAQGNGYYDSEQMTIEDYMDQRPEGVPEDIEKDNDDFLEEKKE